MNLRAIIQRHPIAAYFIMAYTISWGGSFAAVGSKFLRGASFQLVDALFIFLPMLAGPSISGIVMTAVVDGKTGIHDLLFRMRLWRVGMGWYAVAILLPLVLILIVLLTLSYLVSPVFSPTFFPAGIVLGILAGFFEEIGWMGYAYPKMKSKRTTLTTGIYLGLLWTVWHLAADYLGASQALGEFWLPHFLVWMVATFTAMRVLIVWVYTNSRSLLLAQLMHASSSGFAAALIPSLAFRNDMLFWGVYGSLLWLAVIIIAARYGHGLIHKPEWTATK